MEVLLHKGGSPHLKKEILSSADDDGAEISIAKLGKGQSTETCSRSSLSNPKESSTINQEEQLENTRMEMGEVREENERLKLFLSQIVKDYQFLQKKYFDFVQLDHSKISDPDSTAADSNHDMEEEPDQLVSLTLGTSSSCAVQKVQVEEIKGGGEELSLGLDCKLFEGVCRKGSAQNYEIESNNNNGQSPEKSSEEAKEMDEAGEAWPPSKALKNVNGGDDEVLQQPLAKKPRVSVRARCDAPTMNDGCQWRKYGQKIAKGNPCPRAYYRCTVAPGCPVRKQVQRCAEDTSILITTYEGTHNHPLPVAATAMASTTAAAVSMLTSGSSTSPQGMAQAIGLSSPATTPLNGLNFGLFGISSRPTQPSYLPIPSLSSTTSNPTITLDLTSSSTPHLSHFNRLIPRPYSSSTTFNFSSELATPSSWSNRLLSYGSHPYDKNSNNGSLNLNGRQTHDSPLYQSILQKAIGSASSASSQKNPLTDSIAKAITSDPNFQSAIAAAITSYVGSHGAVQNKEGANGASHGLKLGEQLNMNVCGSSYLNKSNGSSSSQH